MLTIKEVGKHYGGTQALKGISLTVSKCSCYGLVGPNGAGKSTLIKILASVIHDYQGKVRYENRPFNKEWKKNAAYVPQEICLEQTVSAVANLTLFGRLYGLRGGSLQKRAKEVLAQIGLAERGKDKVLTFSGGMKRRLNIGCALMNKPNVIIMDEPTVGIDPQSRHYIFQMIQQLKGEECTIIYASHYMEEVEQLCDEVAFIDQGKIVEHGHVDRLLRHYAVPSIFIKGENCLPNNTEQLGTIASRNEGYVLLTKNPLDAMEQVLNHCRNNAGELERLELIQPRLEDVFFSLTGTKLRD